MAENPKIAQPVLVLLHGWGVNRGVWQGIKTLIPANYLVLTPDLPGFGNSRDYPAAYQLEQVVAQLAQQIPDKSYVCGWSLGGLLAIALAKQFPNKVARLALCAASPCFLAQPDWPGMHNKVLQQFATALSDNIPQTIQRFLAIQAMGAEHARADIQQLRQAIAQYPLPESAALQGALRLLAEQDLRDVLASLPQPVSGCFGRLDALVPAAIVPQLQLMLPKAQFMILDKASHAPFISHPQDFVTWLTNWTEAAE